MFKPNNGYDIIIENNSKSLIEGMDLAKSLNGNITILIAIELFTSKSVSLERAAEIAEMNI